jgi:HSP20 family protein
MSILPYRPSTDWLTPALEDFLDVPGRWGGRMGQLMRAPDADVVERENEIRVVIELPGMRAEDIDLDLENNVLTISGEKSEERQEEKDTWHLSERRYGKFSRSFVLPREVEQERIQAHFDNGVLTVVIPKTERARRKRIDIQRGESGQKRVEAKTASKE